MIKAARLVFGVSLIFFTVQSGAQEFDLDYGAKKKKVEVRAAYQYSMQSYVLDGKGFTADTGYIQDQGYSATLLWHRDAGTIALDYINVPYDPKLAANINKVNGGGNTVESNLERYHLFYRPNAKRGEFDAGGSFGAKKSKSGIEYGLDIRRRMNERTTPNQYITSRNSGGVRFGYFHTKNMSSSTQLESNVGLFIPLYYDEALAISGSYMFSVNPDAKLAIVTKINNSIQISAGAQVMYEFSRYDGAGNRGNSNSSETYTNVNIPIELRFLF